MVKKKFSKLSTTLKHLNEEILTQTKEALAFLNYQDICENNLVNNFEGLTLKAGGTIKSIEVTAKVFHVLFEFTEPIPISELSNEDLILIIERAETLLK